MIHDYRLNITFVLLLSYLIMGCSTTPDPPSLTMTAVTPEPGEAIVRDQVFILADASGSMYATFPEEYNLVNAFVEGMPNGSYEAGLSSFGGKHNSEWVKHPLAAFSRSSLATAASDVEFLGGLTPLQSAMGSLEKEFTMSGGRAALLVFSDGKDRMSPVLEATKNLLELHQGELCIFTVQMGADSMGQELLKKMAESSGCGLSVNASDLDSNEGMENFVRAVFFASEIDSDGDGVPDSRDKCPDTPAGIRVDENGCPLDSDGDGVNDNEDECQGTPKGAKVDSRGCWVLQNLNFDTDKHDIKPEFTNSLSEVAKVLSNNPGVRVRIDGHTDSKSSEDYNLSLSQRRAEAVKAFLIERGISDQRLEAKGFGESSPIKANDSIENMYMNRRVEITVIR